MCLEGHHRFGHSTSCSCSVVAFPSSGFDSPPVPAPAPPREEYKPGWTLFRCRFRFHVREKPFTCLGHFLTGQTRSSFVSLLLLLPPLRDSGAIISVTSSSFAAVVVVEISSRFADTGRARDRDRDADGAGRDRGGLCSFSSSTPSMYCQTRSPRRPPLTFTR